jgi:hypothetical protein
MHLPLHCTLHCTLLTARQHLERTRAHTSPSPAIGPATAFFTSSLQLHLSSLPCINSPALSSLFARLVHDGKKASSGEKEFLRLAGESRSRTSTSAVGWGSRHGARIERSRTSTQGFAARAHQNSRTATQVGGWGPRHGHIERSDEGDLRSAPTTAQAVGGGLIFNRAPAVGCSKRTPASGFRPHSPTPTGGTELTTYTYIIYKKGEDVSTRINRPRNYPDGASFPSTTEHA